MQEGAWTVQRRVAHRGGVLGVHAATSRMQEHLEATFTYTIYNSMPENGRERQGGSPPAQSAQASPPQVPVSLDACTAPLEGPSGTYLFRSQRLKVRCTLLGALAAWEPGRCRWSTPRHTHHV